MILFDVNLLVYAHRESTPQHARAKAFLLQVLNSSTAYGVSELVLAGFVRIVTHPKIFNPPSSLDMAFGFVNQIRNRPNGIIIKPETGNFNIFERLCKAAQATGNLVPDAYHAALAIESGSEWVTFDRDYSRFEGLKFRAL